ncbi:glycosyl-transferase for dystroglycan-domain-containing protein [Thelephora terrestris]|uniref:Glycosyl-transferase for dystroglycan-domain-containing protein n=1 Tax=Thelephora terrestris TaxID=56493 RepID=A0A9P6L4T9_9AGAM|nr:glycosyl-transferase for dystroglycan-domain-containing protein [Thelephora terrestris]
MIQRPQPLRSFLSWCLHAYAILATFYTLWNLGLPLLRYRSLARNHLAGSPPRIILPSKMTPQQAEEFLWSNFSLSAHCPLDAWDPILSRAFPRLMHPSRIIPYYYRAAGNFENDDITVTTLISSDRFSVFQNLVQRYKGPISVTIHVSLLSLDILVDLHTIYTSSPDFSTYVDLHLVLSPFEMSEGSRQFNAWRNLARLYARTDFVMMLDVDFVPSTDFRSFIRYNLKQHLLGSGVDNAHLLMERFVQGSVALVVPAFEYARQGDGMNPDTFPRDKTELLDLVHSDPPKVTPFHVAWARGHQSTNYTKYYSIPPGSGQVYQVLKHDNAYEPYAIFSNKAAWCDERFIGYGANKAACLFGMTVAGMEFYVLADHFLIHRSHLYAEKARATERGYNRKLYLDFQEEVCVRSIHKVLREGEPDTAGPPSIRNQCMHQKIAERMTQMIQEYSQGISPTTRSARLPPLKEMV